MVGHSSIFREGMVGVVFVSIALGIALGVGSVASAQRVVLPDRIAMNEEFGGSKFAKAIHQLSESGQLGVTVQPQLEIDHDYSNTYSHQGYYRGGSYGYWNPYYDYSYQQYPYGVDGRLRYGVQPGSRMTTPASTTPAPPAPSSSSQSAPPFQPPTAIEQARLRFVAGDEGEAVKSYRTYVAENPDDFEAAAELAAALIAAGRVDDGIAMIRLAYGSDPALANRPISQRVSLGSREWRGMVIRAVRHAHKRDTASAWLAVSVLMQAEGRDRVGLRMLERAEQRGLDRALVSPLAAAMR